MNNFFSVLDCLEEAACIEAQIGRMDLSYSSLEICALASAYLEQSVRLRSESIGDKVFYFIEQMLKFLKLMNYSKYIILLEIL